MPIYAYRCETCGHAKDVLQRVSDPVLSTCPACGAETFSKQVTAAGFQLKGSGWYVTDFRGDNNANKKPANGEADAAGKSKGETAGQGDSATSAKPAADSSSASSAKPAAAPAPAPAAPAAGATAPASAPAAKS